MDDTTYKIALAGFFHDIGKFAERAGMKVSEEYLNNNADLYQPYVKSQKRHTHKHAVYTAAFIEQYEGMLPEEFNRDGWGLEDSFINLAAGHHNPKTPLQWIIAMADRVSSGFDRQEFDEYSEEIKVRDYTKTRLLALFEDVSLKDKWKDDTLESFKFRYPLMELSPESIFPLGTQEIKTLDAITATKEYSTLFNKFLDSLGKLYHKDNIPLWFEHFENILMIYTAHIPAATVGKVIPDVSLYDHLKTTAALSSAIYKYHLAAETLDIKYIRDYTDNKFLLVSGDFYGIQNFIFPESGSTGKASAKLLRGRSFYVSLITELAADMLCREIGIPSSSIVLNAAGKFTIIAPNTEVTRVKVTEIENNINDWLIKHFYGQSSFGISFIEATCNDFVNGQFPDLWNRLQKTMDRKKFAKFDLSRHGGPVKGYLDSFNNNLERPLCPFCGKRPSIEDASVHVSNEKICSCRICRDHIYIGEHLVKEDRIAITTLYADLERNKLLEPLFGKYQLSFDVSGKLNNMVRTGGLLKYWDIGVKKDKKISKEITAKFINGYVPKYDTEDNDDDRLLTGKKSDEIKLDLVESIKEGSPKTFLHLAKKALNFVGSSDKYTGIEALGILKADVDNLGTIFAFGIKQEKQTISRIATLSRQLNNFFAIYLPYLLSNNPDYKDVYTVFAGGDDLFLIGPWNKILNLSKQLNESFKNYVCYNSDITLSAGISIHKPSDPVAILAESSENTLHKSKIAGKDKITVFGETVGWDELNRLEEIKSIIEGWLADEAINNGMLYRLNELVEMVKQEKTIRETDHIFQLEDMECLKWRSRLKYSVVRNVGKHLKAEEKGKIIEEVLKTILWFEEYGSGIKIPLWQILYNKR